MGTSENFGTYPHQRIWDEVHGGAGVNGQSGSQWGWYLLAGRLENVRAYVDKAVSGVAASREGAAADAATAAMTPLGAWVDEARRLAHETATTIADQTTSFSTAQASIPEVVRVPPESGWREWAVVDWATTSDHEQVQSQATEQERVAREVMNGYQNESNGRLAVLPQFAPPVPSEGSLGTGGGARSGVGSGGGGGEGPVGAGGGGEPGSVGASARSGGAPVTPFTEVAGAGRGGVGDQSPAATAGQGFVPTGGAAGDQVGARPGAGGPSAPGAPGFTGAAAGMPGAGGRHAGSGGSGGGGAGRIGGAGRFGGGGGVGGGGGFGPAGGGGARGFGPGGMGPGGMGPGGAGTAGAAGAGSGPGRGGGVGPMMGMGAAGGGAGGDRDRERPSWLQEQDPNAIVGDLPRTAPPVIGDDPLEADR